MVNLPTVQSFKYIGSTIDRGGGASKYVESRVAKAWSKRRELCGVTCDKKIPTKLKLLLCHTVILRRVSFTLDDQQTALSQVSQV